MTALERLKQAKTIDGGSPLERLKATKTIDAKTDKIGGTAQSAYSAPNYGGIGAWMTDVVNTSNRLGSEYKSRANTFQSAEEYGAYRDKNIGDIDALLARAGDYRNYLLKNEDNLDTATLKALSDAARQYEGYLNSAKEGLNSEYDFRSQFTDERDFGNYLKMAEAKRIEDFAPLKEERAELLRRLEQTGASDTARIAEIEKQLEENNVPDYNFAMGTYGGVRKGINAISHGGAALLAGVEDLFWAPTELLSGGRLGDISDTAMLNKLRDEIVREREDIDARFASNVAAGGKAAKAYDELLTATVAALPQAVVGGSAAVPSAAGLSATATAAMSPSVANTIYNVTSTMAKNPQYWLAFGQTVGLSYDEAIADMEAQGIYDNNTIRTKAALQAIGSGLINAAIEIGGGIQKLPDELANGKGVWKAFVDSAVDEGREEVVQGIIDRAMQNLVYDKGNALASFTDKEAVFSLPAAAEEFAMGTAVGGLLSGGQIAVNKIGNTIAERSYKNGVVRALDEASTMAKLREIAEGMQTGEQTASVETTRNDTTVDSVKKIMGEEGANIFAEGYDATAEDEQRVSYRQNMIEAYAMGRGGKTLAEGKFYKDENGNAAFVTSEQLQRIYEAGLKERATATASSVTRKAAVYKADAGIDYSDAVTSEYVKGSVDKKTESTINTVAKALGVKVRFAEYGTVGGGKANAEIENGIVTIEKNNENPLRFLFGHEITHRMQELAGAEYDRLRAAIETRSGIAERVLIAQNVAAKHGDTLSYTEALDEVVADEIGLLLEDSGEMERFIRKHSDDRTMLEKLRDVVRTIRRKLGNSPEAKRFRETEKLLSAALDKSVETVKKSEQTAEKNTAESSGVKHSIKVINGRLMPVIDTDNDTRSFDAAEAFLMGLIKEENPFATILSDAQAVYVGNDLPSEYRSSEYTKHMNSALRKIKMQAATNLDEMLLLGTDGSWQEDFEGKHGDRAKKGWYRYSTEFAVPIMQYKTLDHYTVYEAVLLIRNDVNGKSYLYDLLDLKEKEKVFSSASRQSEVFEPRPSLDGKVSQPEPKVKANVEIDARSESAAPSRNSYKTWTASEYVREREAAAKDMAEALDITEEKAKAYIDSVNSIAKIIADDRVRLDYEASPGRSSFVSNTEYGGSIDFSTICKKRRLFTGTFEAIQNSLPNTALTADEILEIRKMMDDKGYEVSCGLCYVEGSRANMGQYAKQFIEEYGNTNPEYVPNMAEINTPNGLEKIRLQHPEVYKAYESFMNKLAQRKPKLYQLQTEYKGEILEKFRGKSVDEKNKNGGMRMQSFSDFEIIHLIDCMQVIMDMSRVGLAGQAYTKVPDFAWALGNTGLKINLSLIAKGIDRKGNLVLDEKEGMPLKDAMALRDSYSDNVGTIVVVFTDNQLRAAMADDRIDFIIPFHRSQWNKGQYDAMGLPQNAKDFTSWQNEAYIEPVYNKNGKKQRPSNYMPNEYWDFSKSGKENAETYLAMCAANNRRPKFHYLLVNNGDGSYSLQPDGSTDGYWKTLIDFKMYNNEGAGSPQVPVRPDFNMEQAERMLNEYTGGHNAFPAAQDVVDEFVRKYKAEHKEAKFSRKDASGLTQEIARIQREGKELGHSDAEIQAEIRAAVDEAYSGMIDEFGTMDAGENPYREANVPKRTSKREKVSQTVRTILEAEATPDVIVPDIEQLVAEGAFSYDAYTDEKAIADAERRIAGSHGIGWERAYAEWDKAMDKGEVSKENTTMGWVLYNNAATDGNTQLALDILDKMVEHQRNAAQALQATRILKKLSPDAQLYGAQRSVANLKRELKEKYGDKAPDLKIDTELAEKFLRARTDEGRAAAMRDIYRDIGRQMPSRFIDKWNAWRYLAMLGNPRTHVRNIAGNLGFAPVVAVKDATATAIEAAVSRVSGGKIERSKALVGASARDRALLKSAWGDYSNVQEAVSGGGKYNDAASANKQIEEGRRIFNLKPLEAARKGNSAALEAEDAWFSRPHYAYAMAQYCKAHGIGAEQIASGKGINEARKYAIVEAQKATYRDTNAFSQTISEIGRYRGKNPVGRVVSTLMEGILPFRKTPANILVRGMEYSPLGLMNGIKQALWDVKRGNKTAAEAIDSIAAGLTGTGLLALGALLAAQGLVRGHGGTDEDENEFEELMGHQAYSLEIGDTSVTLDWLAPECLPLFVGVNIWEQSGEENENVTLSTILSSITNVSEPLLEMSCLQSLNDIFDSVGYAASNDLAALPAILASAATSYLTQGIPTIFGQAERTLENKRYTTYTEKNAFLTSDMQYTLGRASARFFGDYQQIPYIDAWGREEQTGSALSRSFNNFLNPSYVSSPKRSAMESELLRLYEQTGEASIFPARAKKYFTVDGERKDLTADEYVKYAKALGQRSYEVVSTLAASAQYKRLSDAEKVRAIKEAYSYANQEAKTKVSKFSPESWVKNASDAKTKYGISISTYAALRAVSLSIEGLKDEDGETIDNSKPLQIMEAIYAMPGLTDEQRYALFIYLGVGKSVRHLSKQSVENKLKTMREKAK